MNTKKLLNTLFLIRDVNLYDNIANIINVTNSRQAIYNYLMRDSMTLKDFIAICDNLKIDIKLHIDDNSSIDIHTLTE